MKHTFLGPILGLAVSLAAGSAAAQDPAAMVSVRASSGSVTVNGTELVEGQSLGVKVGDTITVTNGEALVTYGNLCMVAVTDAHTVSAQPPATCATAAHPPRSRISGTAIGIGVGVAAAAAAAGGGGGGDDEPKPSSP